MVNFYQCDKHEHAQLSESRAALWGCGEENSRARAPLLLLLCDSRVSSSLFLWRVTSVLADKILLLFFKNF